MNGKHVITNGIDGNEDDGDGNCETEPLIRIRKDVEQHGLGNESFQSRNASWFR